MPYDTSKRQATAVFLNIKRRKGSAAARAFGQKHRADLKAEGYRPRSQRSR